MQVPPAVPENRQLYIGIMSGTSMDGIDGVLCSIDQFGQSQILVHTSSPYSPELKTALLELQHPIANELHLEALAANQVAKEYALIVERVLQLAQIKASAIVAIGAHGQTIRHQPKIPDQIGYSKQCLNGTLLAELTHIDVVNDFRSRDIAALGQGAPLVPAFHQMQFGDKVVVKAILNLGGIANLSLLDPQQAVLGFDTGPGNVLLDEWIAHHQELPYDHNGLWARSGQFIPQLLDNCLDDPYFQLEIPKSTGRDLFNPVWLNHYLSTLGHPHSPEDIQATLVELTVRTISQHLFKYLPNCEELIICGGGSRNLFLLERLTIVLQENLPNLIIMTSEEKGLDPQTIEAIAFAWLAWSFVQRSPSDIPSVTGAVGPRVLGTLHPK